MAARARGLSPDDVRAIREQVTAGRKPKVVFTEAAGQIAGQLGQVVSVGDPSAADEFVVVRFGRDELPFAPSDLRVAPKGAVARKAVPAPSPPAVPPEPEFVIDKPVVPSSRRRGSPPGGSHGGVRPAAEGGGASPPGSAEATPSGGSGRAASPPRADGSDPASAAGSSPGARAASGAGKRASANGSSAASPPGPAVSSGAVSAPAPRSSSSVGSGSARKGARARPKGPAGLTVTLAYAEGEWTVAASQGAKTLARPYVVKPAEALRMVSLVDVPGVQEAVAQILAAERDEAEREAERLRAELAEVEARLAELREAE